MGGTDKRTDSGAMKKKREGFDEYGSGGRRQTNADALEDNNGNENEVDKGRTEVAENGGREKEAPKAKAGSIHRPPPG